MEGSRTVEGEMAQGSKTVEGIVAMEGEMVQGRKAIELRKTSLKRNGEGKESDEVGNG